MGKIAESLVSQLHYMDYNSSDHDRVGLLIEAAVGDGMDNPFVSKVTDGYSVSLAGTTANPAFEELASIYKDLKPDDRVEVLVYDGNHSLQHAFVDTPVDQYNRGYVHVSKTQRTYGRLSDAVDGLINQLNIQPLSITELARLGHGLDSIIVKDTFNASF